MALKTDYKNAVFSGNRKYNQISNADGTISLVDATTYTQTGDKFGATEINTICQTVNVIESGLSSVQGKSKVWYGTSATPPTSSMAVGDIYVQYK